MKTILLALCVLILGLRDARSVVPTTLPDLKPTLSKLVKDLSDRSNDVRADAAAALRQALAADPAAAPNCHDKDYWERRVAEAKPGLTLKDALNILLPDLTDKQRQQAAEMGMGTGPSSFTMYRLDDYWRAELRTSNAAPEMLLQPPKLERSTRQIWVEPPAKYTGTWGTWYVNGQKAHEIQYANGKYDGTFTSFNDDGSRCFEQHYKKNVIEGADTGWYRSGAKSYEGQHKAGRQVGTWRWFSEDGRVTSIQEHGAGGK